MFKDTLPVKTSIKQSWLCKFITSLIVCNLKKKHMPDDIPFKFKPLVLYLHLHSCYSIYMLSVIPVTKSSVASICSNIIALTLWYIIQVNGNNFLELYRTTEILEKATDTGSRFRNICINVCLLVPFLIPALFSSLMVLTLSQIRQSAFVEFWLWGYEFSDQLPLESFLLFLSGYIYFSVYLTPSVLSMMYIIFCKVIGSSVEKFCSKNLNTDAELMAALKLLHLIITCSKKVEQCYSLIISLILLEYSAQIFMAISLVIEMSKVRMHRYICEIILTFIICSSYLIGIIFVASGVSKSISNAKVQFQMMYRMKIIDNIFTDRRKLLVLQILSNTKVEKLSACNTLYLDRSLIISFLGCFVTYGFLLIQLSAFQVQTET